MLRPARLLLAALALVAWSSSARADEPSARTHHARRHHRRAKLDDHTARAARDGSQAGPTERTTTAPKAGKHVMVEKAESIGSPNEGHLKGGAHLDLKKPYFRVVPVYESGDVRWALPIMVSMIDRAARSVNKRFPGSVLDVGDLSQRGGGDLLRHHSHESGRDADLGFYALDAKGKQLHARTFIKFDPNMTSPTVPGAKFDLARNWAFIQELLTDPAARVSHIFVAEWIKRELLAYARPRVAHAIFERAQQVMMQPHNSLPHDDHIHVRISCPHEAHSQCIELAKTAPHGKSRVAHKSHGGRTLKTPAARPHAPKAAAAAPQDPVVIPIPEPAAADDPVVDLGEDLDVD